jgi:hypothetical protein
MGRQRRVSAPSPLVRSRANGVAQYLPRERCAFSSLASWKNSATSFGQSRIRAQLVSLS